MTKFSMFLKVNFVLEIYLYILRNYLKFSKKSHFSSYGCLMVIMSFI